MLKNSIDYEMEQRCWSKRVSSHCCSISSMMCAIGVIKINVLATEDLNNRILSVSRMNGQSKRQRAFLDTIPQMREQILIQDLSVPITFAWTLFKLPHKDCITGLENDWWAFSSCAANWKSKERRDLIACLWHRNVHCEIWSAAAEQRQCFCNTPKTKNIMSRPLPWWVLHGQGYVSH